MKNKRKFQHLTFRPLKRGYFRCNQTGERTRDCESYRRAHEEKPANRHLTKVKMYPNKTWKCPQANCGKTNSHGVLNQEDICTGTGCGKKVMIVGLQPAEIPQKRFFPYYY